MPEEQKELDTLTDYKTGAQSRDDTEDGGGQD